MKYSAIEFPNIEFSTKSEMHKAILQNSDRIIHLKKSEIYKSSEKGQISCVSNPSIVPSVKSSLEVKEGFIYPVISTTRFMDSHKDCHFDGCFKKTIKEQKGKILYALDHQLKYNDVLAWPENVKMSIEQINWSDLGKSYSGSTEGLVFTIKKEDIRFKNVLLDIEQRANKFENSIRMVYHKIVLGVNSDSKEFKQERDYYEKRIDSIVNSDLVKEDGYFYGVEELGIHKEGSLVVAGGSNDATSIFSKDEPLSTHLEPSQDTQKRRKKILSTI